MNDGNEERWSRGGAKELHQDQEALRDEWEQLRPIAGMVEGVAVATGMQVFEVLARLTVLMLGPDEG